MRACVLWLVACGGGAPASEVPPPVTQRPAAVEEPVSTPAPVPDGPPSADLGTSHPLFVQAAAPAGRWVAACQARNDTDGDGRIAVQTGHHGELFGDAAELYLMTAEDPEGERIDDVVAHDPSGRWLVFVRGGEMILRDTTEGRDLSLSASGPTAAADPNPSMPHRGASFDADGTHLLYLRGPDGHERIVVRELSSGTEREVAHAAGRLWRASLVGDGSWIAAAVVTADTNGNGTLDLPALQTTLAGGACRGAPLSYSTYGYRGDAFERRFLRTSGGAPETREVVGFGGDAVLVRAADRALRWVPATGAEREAVPAACDAQVWALYPPRRAVLVACRGAGTPPPFRVYDAQGTHDLGIAASPHTVPDRMATEARVTPAGSSFLVDLAQPRVVPRAYAGEQGFLGDRVLETVRGGIVRIRDVRTGDVARLTDGTDRYVHGRQWGRHAAVEHEQVLLIDLEAERIAGALPAMPVAVRDDGWCLVPASSDVRVPEGPLRWVRPTSVD